MEKYGLHWFRRDLRLKGNSAFLWNAKKHSGRVLGIFFFDSTFLSRPDFSHSRFGFFLNTLEALRNELNEIGGDLLILDRPPIQGFFDVFNFLDRTVTGKPAVVSFSRDYEPFARERDSQVTELLETQLGVEAYTERDHLLIEPNELFKPGKTDSFYQIYTPFAKRWFEISTDPSMQKRITNSVSSVSELRLRWNDVLKSKERGLPLPDLFKDQLAKFKTENLKKVKIPLPSAGSHSAWKELERFESQLKNYSERRDFPAFSATSHLSIYLKNGSITVPQILSALTPVLKNREKKFKEESGPIRFLKELVWREFYYHILWHCPRVEHEAFQPQFRELPWENNPGYFEAWKAGRTGFPIVDAGMRELRQTGLMHNRVRMIVASFLTKDLLIDWRWGERYFMEQLLDGDLAANNGNWQWVASTGCDPQPYFRIFNPLSQSQKFDPEGIYIQKWCPEKRGISKNLLHLPTRPIIDHSIQKEKALTLFRKEKQRYDQRKLQPI